MGVEERFDLSRTDQLELIEQVTNAALSDQSLGELARLVEGDLTEPSETGYNTQNGRVSLPSNDSQLKHILRDDEGHLLDSPENRALLVDLANDSSKFVGTDQYGNSWNAELLVDGTQNWVRYRNGIIINGGRNVIPQPWNNKTGFNHSPTQWRKR